MTTEKFCLRWNDFESNISGAFRELRDDKDFFDVTIACEDEQMQAHKVILSACSPFFRNVLRRNPHQHPLLYLKGVKYTDLQSVLNFMYHGEVNVAQEELNSFLAVAEDLRVKGLTQNQGNPSSSRQRDKSPTRINKPRIVEREPPPPPKRPKPPTPSQNYSSAPSAPTQSFNADDDDIQELPSVKTEPREAPVFPPPAAPTIHHPSTPIAESQMDQHQIVEQDNSAEQYGDEGAMGEYEDYGAYGDSSYDENQYSHSVVPADGGKGGASVVFSTYLIKDPSLGPKGLKCTLCSKTGTDRSNLKKHVENIHFPGTLSYSCKYCSETFLTRNSLNHHISKNHKGFNANSY